MDGLIKTFVVVIAALMVAGYAQAAPRLTDSSGRELTKREAVVLLLKGSKVQKCTDQELTDKMTLKAKTSDKE